MMSLSPGCTLMVVVAGRSIVSVSRRSTCSIQDAFSAMAAFVLGVVQFIAPKGTMPHKTIGAFWILLNHLLK